MVAVSGAAVSGADQELAELRRVLKSVPFAMRKRLLTRASRAGAAFIAKRAKSTSAFQDRTGALRHSIMVSSVRLTREGNVLARVSAGAFKKGRKKTAGIKDPYYAHMIERGTVKMSPRPFLAPALFGSAAQVVAIMRDSVFKNFEREMSKLRKVK